MTRAEIYRSKDGYRTGFSIRGHAGGKIKKGEYDLICAAISAVGYTITGALQELCGAEEYSESDGNLEMKLPENMSGEQWAKAQTILNTLEIGLKQIETQYPRHIQVELKEV